MSKLERDFQSRLIKDLHSIFEGCLVLKNDANYIQGIPDLVIFFNDRWAMLECKKSGREHRQPNQEYYIDMLNEMSFAAFIYPENKEDVLYELQQAFAS